MDFAQLQRRRAQLSHSIATAVNSVANCTDEDTCRELDVRIKTMREQLRQIDDALADAEPPESLPDFVRRHGGKPVPIDQRGELAKGTAAHIWLLPDGAVFHADGVNSSRSEPPADPERNWRQRRDYARAKLARAERHFLQLKDALQGMAPVFQWPENEYGPSPSSDGEAALRHLAGIVKDRRKALNAIDSEPIAVQRHEQEARKQRDELHRQAEMHRLENERRQRIAAIET